MLEPSKEEMVLTAPPEEICAGPMNATLSPGNGNNACDEGPGVGEKARQARQRDTIKKRVGAVRVGAGVNAGVNAGVLYGCRCGSGCEGEGEGEGEGGALLRPVRLGGERRRR